VTQTVSVLYRQISHFNSFSLWHHYHTTTVLRPFFWDHRGEPVPEENSGLYGARED